MNSPFRLDQHPRRAGQPLSSPPPGYFERLPTQVMARVQAPARRSWAPGWLLPVPAALRTGLASTLLLGAFAASLWLGGSLTPTTGPAGLDGVSQAELLDYLTNGDVRVELPDLAELPARRLPTGSRYLRPSAGELAQALDEQPLLDEQVY